MELYLRKGVPLVVPVRTAVANAGKSQSATPSGTPSLVCSSPSDLLVALRSVSSLSRDSISLLAFQLVLLAKPDELSGYFSMLLFAWSSEFRDVLSSNHNVNKSFICGRVFKKDEIIWECKQCGMDGTCVQCDACFKKSDHTGHDVMFHKSSGGGGCCDCGDPEAWSPQGCCPDHRRTSASGAEGVAGENPLLSLSADCQTGFAALLDGAILALTSIACQSVRGFEPWASNPFTSGTVSSVVLRLFNDDVHTYDDVTSALLDCRHSDSQSRTLTKLVDKMGSAVVRRGAADTIEPAWRAVRQTFDLTASVVPDWLVDAELTAVSALLWFKDVGMLNPGLKRLISTSFASCLKNGPLSAQVHELAAEMAYANPAFRAYLTYDEMFPPNETGTSQLMFPCKLPMLDSRRPARDRSQRTPIPADLQRNPMLTNAEIRCPLSIFLAASMLLNKQWQAILEDIVLNFQHDLVFRHSFTQLLTIFYPYLNGLYCCGIGTSTYTILVSTAQLYTSQTMVHLMSSNGVKDRFFNEYVAGPDGKPLSEPANITTMIMTAGVDAFKLCELGRTINPLGNEAVYSKNACARHHKYHRTFMDLEYVLRGNEFALSVLSGASDPGAVQIWVKLCMEMTGVEYHRREKGTSYVSQDTDHWAVLLEAAMTMERTSSTFLQSAFTSPLSARSQVVDLGIKQHQALVHVTNIALKELTYYWKSLQDSVAINVDCSSFYRLVDVSNADVTIYITLQRFLLKTIVTACRGGVRFSFSDLIPLFSHAGFEAIMSNTIWPQFQGMPFSTDTIGRKFASFLIANEALRVLSFAAQVRAKLWNRNGSMPSNIILNYESLLCSHDFRDIDIFALQLSLMLSSDVSLFVATCLYTFEISELPASDVSRIDRIPLALEHRTYAMAALLRVFILMTTLVPMDFFDESIPHQSGTASVSGYQGAFDLLLKRELLHLIASKASNVSDIARIKSTLGCSSRSIPDAHIDAILNSLIDKEKPDSRRLLPIHALDFDVEHAHLSQSSQQKGIESIRDLRSSLKRDAQKYKLNPNAPFPVVSAASLLPLHSSFRTLRCFLFNPRFIAFLHMALDFAVPTKADEKPPNSLLIICRVVHIVTLMLHCYDDTNANAVSSHKLPPAARPESPDFLDGVMKFNEALHEASSSASSLIKRLCEVYSTGLISSDSLYHEGLLYILLEFGKRSSYVQEVLLPESGIIAMSAASSNVAEGSKVERRRRSEKKALLTIVQSAVKFCQENSVAIPKALSDSFVKLQGVEPTPSKASVAEEERDSRPLETGDEDEGAGGVICTVCRAEASDEQPCGLLCHIQPSRIVANIILSNEFLGLESTDSSGSKHHSMPFSTTHRVMFREGVDIYSGASEDKRIGHLSYGDYVVIAKRESQSKWAQVTLPISGWCRMYLEQNDKYICERSGAELTAKNVIPLLQPIKEMMFNRFGGTRTHVSICGHAMHQTCYDRFYIATLQYQSEFERETRQCLFRCPMCSAVGNAFLPILPSMSTAQSVTAEFSYTGSELWHKWDQATAPSFDKEVIIRCRTLASTLTDVSSPYDMFRRCSPYEVKIPQLSECSPYEMAERLWSAGAYTLLGSTFNALTDSALSFQSDAESHMKPIHNREKEAIMGLIQFCRNLQFFLWSEPGSVNYNEAVLARFENLIFGDRSFPFETVTNHEPLVSESSEDAIYHTLDHLPNQFIPENQSFFEAARVRKQLKGLLSDEDSWRYLNLPLLSHDLHIIAFGAVSNIRDAIALSKVIKALILARLFQTLIEPSCNPDILLHHVQTKYQAETKAMSSPDSNSDGSFIEICLKYRKLAGVSNYDTLDKCPIEMRGHFEAELKAIVADSLLHYSHFVTCLADIVIASNVVTHSVFTDVRIPFANSLVAYLSMWELPTDVFSCTQYFFSDPLSATWASQYRRFHSRACRLPEHSLDYWIPQQLIQTRVSGKRKATTLGGDTVNNSLCGDSAEFQSSNTSNERGTNGPSTAIEDGLGGEMDVSPPHTGESNENILGGDEASETSSGAIEEVIDSEDEDNDDEDEHDDYDDDDDAVSMEDDVDEDDDEEGIDFAAMDLINEVFDFGVMTDLMGNQMRQRAGGNAEAEGGATDSPEGVRDEVAPVSINGSKLESKLTSWAIVGADPGSVIYDDAAVSRAFTEQMSCTPYIGSISGTSVVFTSQIVPSKFGIIDASHFGLGLRHRRSFIKLPQLYTDLYQQIKLPHKETDTYDAMTALCLVCGQVVKAGMYSARRQGPHAVGECTLHSYRCGGGQGVFLLLDECRILLTSDGRQVYHPSIYLNRNGETEEMRYSTRPHYLNEARLRKLEDLYFHHKVAAEVYVKRRTSTHLIRLNWY